MEKWIDNFKVCKCWPKGSRLYVVSYQERLSKEANTCMLKNTLLPVLLELNMEGGITKNKLNAVAVGYLRGKKRWGEELTEFELMQIEFTNEIQDEGRM